MTDTPRNPPSMFVDPEARGVVRSRYLPGQTLSWQDLAVDQDYQTLQRRSVNRYGLGFTGVMHGLDVTLEGQTVVVSPGMAIDAWGREILLVGQASLSLTGLDAFEGDRVFYVNIAYYEFTRVFGPPGDQREYARTVESPHLYWSGEKPLSAPDGVVLATLERKAGKIDVVRSAENGRTLIARRLLFSDAQTQNSAVGCAITLASDGRSLLVDGAMSITPLPSADPSSAAEGEPSAPVFSVKARVQGSAEPIDALTLSGSGDLALTGMVSWTEPKATLRLGPRAGQVSDPSGFAAPQLQLQAPAIYLDGPVWLDVNGAPTPIADAGYWKLDKTKQVLYYAGDVELRDSAGNPAVDLSTSGVSTFARSLAVSQSAAFGTNSILSGWSLYAENGASIKGAAGSDKLALDVQGTARISGDTTFQGSLQVTGFAESRFTGPVTMASALNLEGTTAASHVAGSLDVQGLLEAKNLQVDDSGWLRTPNVINVNGPLVIEGKGGLELHALDTSGNPDATVVRVLPQSGASVALIEARTGGQTALRIDAQGQAWSLPRQGTPADVATLARLLGPDADRFTLDPSQLSTSFPSKVDQGLVDATSLIAALVQAVTHLGDRVDQQSSTSSSLLDKIGEIAKVVAGLGLR